MNHSIFLLDGNKICRFLSNDILRIEACGSYAIIYSKHKEPFKSTKLLKEIMELLDNDKFFRTHKSYVVNMNEIDHYNAEERKVKMNDGSFVPVAFRMKSKLRKRLLEK